MEAQEIFIAHPNTTEQVNALKAFMKALKIEFKTTKEKGYKPEFVSKIEESKAQVKAGKTTRVEKDKFKEFLGL